MIRLPPSMPSFSEAIWSTMIPGGVIISHGILYRESDADLGRTNEKVSLLKVSYGSRVPSTHVDFPEEMLNQWWQDSC